MFDTLSVLRCSRGIGQTVVRQMVVLVAALSLLVASLPFAHAADLFGVRQDGQEIAAGDISGWKLVYFGFTHCPEICPTALHSMTLALDELGPIGEGIKPVFVTVDPERDTPEIVAQYVSYFSPRMIGITPHPDQLADLAKEWRVKYERVELADDGSYSMDHTAAIFLTDPSGTIVGRYQHDLDGPTLANQIRATMLAR